MLNKYVKEDETIIYVGFFLLETRFMFFRIAVEWDFVDTQLPLVKAQWCHYEGKQNKLSILLSIKYIQTDISAQKRNYIESYFLSKISLDKNVVEKI